MASGSTSGASRSNSATRTTSQVTTPSGPHTVGYTMHPSKNPLFAIPAGLTAERGKSAGGWFPTAGRNLVRTNPHVVSGLARQHAVRPARTFGMLGGSYRRTPPIR